MGRRRSFEHLFFNKNPSADIQHKTRKPRKYFVTFNFIDFFENTSYSQKLHIPASPSEQESLTINAGQPATTLFLKNTYHNQEFRIRNCFQIQLSTSDSWSFLPIPELQAIHGCLTDHLQSLNKCKAEFRNLCISGITRKCRNSWSFLTIPELQISHPHTLTHSPTPSHDLFFILLMYLVM